MHALSTLFTVLAIATAPLAQDDHAALLGITQTTNADDGPIYEGETWSGTVSGHPGTVVTIDIVEFGDATVIQSYTVTIDSTGHGYWKYPIPVGMGYDVLLAKPSVNGFPCPARSWAMAVVAQP